MLNKRGENVYFFLAERCTELQAIQAQLAEQVVKGFASAEDQARFLAKMLRVDAQLQTCEQLKSATFDSSRRFSESMQLALGALDIRVKQHIATIRNAPASLSAGLAKESLPYLLSLHQELTEYLEDETAEEAA